MDKQYIIRKYVMVRNVQEALKKERDIKADEAWIDDDWEKENSYIAKPIGYKNNVKRKS